MDIWLAEGLTRGLKLVRRQSLKQQSDIVQFNMFCSFSFSLSLWSLVNSFLALSWKFGSILNWCNCGQQPLTISILHYNKTYNDDIYYIFSCQVETGMISEHVKSVFISTGWSENIWNVWVCGRVVEASYVTVPLPSSVSNQIWNSSHLCSFSSSLFS